VIERSDETLLAALDAEPEAFAEFYRRHVTAVLGYFVRRTRDPELAADRCAETFAAALAGAHRFRPERRPGDRLALRHRAAPARARAPPRRGRGPGPPAAWDGPAGAHRRGARAHRRARHRRSSALHAALDSLPADQREALEARVVDERGYDEIALAARTSESVVRKRVSRGLAGLRQRMGGDAR
jgi:DNA-directed RNA polymerase specialized sigma24 family protein